VDGRLGEMDTFKELVDKAHEKGLKVLLDLPLNHVAWEHPFRNDPDKADWFHNCGDVKNWDDPKEAECGSIFGLPDLAQENPEVYNYLVDVSKFWMRTGIDGFRLDAVKNINFDFWPQYNKDIHEFARDELGKNDFFLIGECFDTRTDKVNSYQQNDMDSLFDYPLKFTAHEVLAHGGNMGELARVLDEGNRVYQSPELMSGFLDSHDTQRFLSAAGGDKERLSLALDFLFTINRVPSLYYGTETGMDATPPPGQENIGWPATSRKDMEFEGSPEVRAHLTELSRIRNGSEALKHGSLKEMWVDEKVFAFGRNHPDQEAVVFLNNGDSHESRQVPLRPENRLIASGTVLVDALSGQEVTVTDGKISVELAPKSARIF
ncbi:MAG: alpha-glucosidase C-terminal domain-containing protein, partial [Candidatus Eremiobacteraeota bacterium]|nr:alpha-glucosidase C-terminal domain-containing protein [Candidatus Eremiobacteraeota bacterium]